MSRRSRTRRSRRSHRKSPRGRSPSPSRSTASARKKQRAPSSPRAARARFRGDLPAPVRLPEPKGLLQNSGEALSPMSAQSSFATALKGPGGFQAESLLELYKRIVEPLKKSMVPQLARDDFDKSTSLYTAWKVDRNDITKEKEARKAILLFERVRKPASWTRTALAQDVQNGALDASDRRAKRYRQMESRNKLNLTLFRAEVDKVNKWVSEYDSQQATVIWDQVHDAYKEYVAPLSTRIQTFAWEFPDVELGAKLSDMERLHANEQALQLRNKGTQNLRPLFTEILKFKPVQRKPAFERTKLAKDAKVQENTSDAVVKFREYERKESVMQWEVEAIQELTGLYETLSQDKRELKRPIPPRLEALQQRMRDMRTRLTVELDLHSSTNEVRMLRPAAGDTYVGSVNSHTEMHGEGMLVRNAAPNQRPFEFVGTWVNGASCGLGLKTFTDTGLRIVGYFTDDYKYVTLNIDEQGIIRQCLGDHERTLVHQHGETCYMAASTFLFTRLEIHNCKEKPLLLQFMLRSWANLFDAALGSGAACPNMPAALRKKYQEFTKSKFEDDMLNGGFAAAFLSALYSTSSIPHKYEMIFVDPPQTSGNALQPESAQSSIATDMQKKLTKAQGGEVQITDVVFLNAVSIQQLRDILTTAYDHFGSSSSRANPATGLRGVMVNVREHQTSRYGHSIAVWPCVNDGSVEWLICDTGDKDRPVSTLSDIDKQWNFVFSVIFVWIPSQTHLNMLHLSSKKSSVTIPEKKLGRRFPLSWFRG